MNHIVSETEVRASELVETNRFREFGDDEAVNIVTLDHHGDSVIITGTVDGGESVERTLDRDEVVILNPED